MGAIAGVRGHDAAQAALILHAVQQNDSSARIASVSSIVQEPNSENVVVNYNRLVPDSIRGSLDDPQIRQLLLLGAQNRVDSDVRDDSVGLLADECRAGHQCTDGPIRNALMVAMLYDKSPSVRLKALDGLQPYIGDDMRVRDAVLESLMNDSDAQIRAEAIGLLRLSRRIRACAKCCVRSRPRTIIRISGLSHSRCWIRLRRFSRVLAARAHALRAIL